jgi:hypothetical protein
MKRNQELSLRTDIVVMDVIIGEVSQSIIAGPLTPFSDGNVGMNMGVLDGLDVLGSSIGHIAGDLIGPITPPEEHDGVNRRATTVRIGLVHELPDKGEIKCPVEMAIEVIIRH